MEVMNKKFMCGLSLYSGLYFSTLAVCCAAFGVPQCFGHFID